MRRTLVRRPEWSGVPETLSVFQLHAVAKHACTHRNARARGLEVAGGTGTCQADPDWKRERAACNCPVRGTLGQEVQGRSGHKNGPSLCIYTHSPKTSGSSDPVAPPPGTEQHFPTGPPPLWGRGSDPDVVCRSSCEPQSSESDEKGHSDGDPCEL